MIDKQYIHDFEAMGLGMFVHFGLYSILAKGEWAKHQHNISDARYEALAAEFDPAPDWAERLADAAKSAGCKYITLTTRHHDGFSLYDTCGLNSYDASHAKCGRDLVREFVDACRKREIVPFFYHTLIDWHEKTFETDFSAYLRYLRASVELLCKNYGKIGGLWFDGTWGRPADTDWQEDALYKTIRSYQPEAMIINNTGMVSRGSIGHIELDSVTFERGRPQPLNFEGAPKYLASEMCEVFCDHWGYAEDDLNYKSPAGIIEELADCRKFGSNFLLNVGPKPDGTLRTIDAGSLELVGKWMQYFGEAVRKARPTGITIEGKTRDFVLKDQNFYYLFCFGLPEEGDSNVAIVRDHAYASTFELHDKIKCISWMDDDTAVRFTQQDGRVTVYTAPYAYGRNLVVRVAKIECE